MMRIAPTRDLFGSATLASVSIVLVVTLALVGCDDGGPDPESDAPADVLDVIDGADDVSDDADTTSSPRCGFEVCGAEQQCCDYACVDVAVDPQHCGGCGVLCSPDETCVEGTCTCGEAVCIGRETCCLSEGDPTCIDPDTDIDHCGACGVTCGASEVCYGGRCACLGANGRIEVCTEGETCCAGEGCRGLDYDPRSCGACGLACGEGELCVDGRCACGATQAAALGENACATGQACCGSPATCKADDDPECQCGTSTCGSGESCCALDTGVDACVSTWRDPAFCGDCSTSCGPGQACQASVCLCHEGLADCNGDDSDGCEARLATDPAHCGTCGNTCAPGEVCDGHGRCTVSCTVGMTDCNGECVDLNWDRENCGACGNACGPGEVANGAGVCATECLVGLSDCDGECVNLLANRFHCGACGVACGPGEVCDGAGACALNCAPGLTPCGTTCVDLSYDRAHCGACGVTCAAGEVCDQGQCVISCPSTLTECRSGCVDLDANPYHCGACGNACDGTSERCVDGVCQVECPASEGIVACDGRCVDTRTDPQHCGGCDQACSTGEFCIDGLCDTGCPGTLCKDECVDLQTDPGHCGACNVVCDVSETCQSGRCCDAQAGCGAPADIAVGGGSACAVHSDGTAVCWGSTLIAPLGGFVTIPRIDGSTQTAVDVEVGGFTGCARTSVGQLFCWGQDVNGQLGGEPDATGVAEVFTGRPPTGLAIASNGGCARLEDGLECWGRSNDRFGGADIAWEPTRIANVGGIFDVAIGTSTICAVVSRTDLASPTTGVTCWGRDTAGELGCSGCSLTGPGETWVELDDGSGDLVDVLTVVGGYTHYCALRSDGAVLCWGQNDRGQLGDGCTTGCASRRATPVEIDPAEPQASFKQVSVSDGHGCAVTADERIVCWGRNEDGELGHTCRPESLTTCSQVSQARYVRDENGSIVEGALQVDVGPRVSCARLRSGLVCWGDGGARLGPDYPWDRSNVQSDLSLPESPERLEAGVSRTCAFMPTTPTHCWGAGYDSTVMPSSMVPAPLPTSDVVDVAVARIGTWCELQSSGAVQCVGANDDGVLGDGCDPVTAQDCVASANPVPVAGFDGSLSVTAITASYDSFCALMGSGGVKCWGANWGYQLGDGTTDPSGTPVDVAGLAGPVVELAAGDYHYCARIDTGAIQCWGTSFSRLGISGEPTLAAPTTIPPLDGTAAESSAISLSARGETTCAVVEDGSWYCWGRNGGRFGNGSNADSDTPVAVTTIGGAPAAVSAVRVGLNHTCLLRVSGALYCTGANDEGQLGDGTTTHRSTPVQVLDFDGTAWTATAVATGEHHTCVVRASDGHVVCAGADGDGELGTGLQFAPDPVSVALP